jgi:hypothetical protein
MRRPFSVVLVLFAPLYGGEAEYRRRLEAVVRTPGLVAFWDFVKRDAETRRFAAHQPAPAAHAFSLDAVNYVSVYWDEGREASYEDFPLLGEGPFGQAVRIRAEADAAFRPVLMVPRERLHDTGLDVKGPGSSVSLVAWVKRESGNHAIAGIWHEGTDLKGPAGLARRVERGRRQYALFAGLAANPGAAAVHVSENGASSFGDRYARNLAVTPQVLDEEWRAAGFVFDNRRNTVTAYFDGVASDFWIDNPEAHPFFQWPAKAWQQAEWRRQPGLQPGEDPNFPAGQFYSPPEDRRRRRTLLESRPGERVELEEFPFTKVRVTRRNGAVVRRELVALRVNPFWFGHDLYAPKTADDGGPFTIGRVIHSSRSVGFTGWIGGVAVFNRPLSRKEMGRLARIGLAPITAPIP